MTSLCKSCASARAAEHYGGPPAVYCARCAPLQADAVMRETIDGMSGRVILPPDLHRRLYPERYDGLSPLVDAQRMVTGYDGKPSVLPEGGTFSNLLATDPKPAHVQLARLRALAYWFKGYELRHRARGWYRNQARIMDQVRAFFAAELGKDPDELTAGSFTYDLEGGKRYRFVTRDVVFNPHPYLIFKVKA